MRLNDRVFGGANRYFWANEASNPVAGFQSWFGDFQPVNSRGLAFTSALLKFFFGLRICCHCNGISPLTSQGIRHPTIARLYSSRLKITLY
jgi:hypothetical protein